MKTRCLCVLALALLGCTDRVRIPSTKKLAVVLRNRVEVNTVSSFAVTVAWDAPLVTDPVVTGYKLYRGGSSRHYDTVQAVPAIATQVEAQNLSLSSIYYFALTAFNDAGESGFSNELVTLPPKILSQGFNKDYFYLNYERTLPERAVTYSIEASTDLVTWGVVQTDELALKEIRPNGSQVVHIGVPKTLLPANYYFFRIAMKVKVPT